MAIIYVDTRSKNLPDSGAWQIHKFGTAAGEQRITLEGNWEEDKNLFDFYLKDVEFYFFTKSDLLDYISSIEEEINFPTQAYSCKDYLKFYEDKKSEIIDYPSDFITMQFEANPRPGGTAYIASKTREDSNIYNFFRSICLSSEKKGRNNAYTTYLFVKYQNTKNGKFYINLVPIFSKKYTMDELSKILKRTLTGATDTHVALNLFGLKYAEQINSGGYKCKDLIEAAGFNDEDLVTELEIALKVFKQLKDDQVTINPISHKRSLLGAYIDQTTEKSATILPDEPLQKISYGAPGTGKSHGTNKVVRSYKDTVRTTFHPDSDYSTFVGSYKPTTTKEPVLGLCGKDTVQLINPLTREPLETTKIVYKFIKQAFLKAYILAWKKMCQVKLPTSTTPTSTTSSTTLLTTPPTILSFKEGEGLVTITQVTASELTYKKEEVTTYEDIKKLWDNSWNNGVFAPKSDSGSGISLNRSVACAVHDQITNATQEDFDKGWKALIEALRSKDIVSSPGNQEYTLSYNDSDTTIKITTTNIKNKTRLNDCFVEKQGVSIVGVEKGMMDILKQLDSNNFDTAWNKLRTIASGTTSSSTSSTTLTDPLTDIRQFLVIEEINRGNCAQIFGDLFQLLDRKNGFSEYPIEADEDIQKALLDENPDDGLSFGKDGLTLPEEVKNELREVFEGDANPDAIIKKICMGKVLVLPSNLYIWATMNTSDQSLFPIDSAFKRRWDWEYVPIKNHSDENWKIKIENETYDWWKFLVKVNNIINELTSSEDKKLGYFFAKAQNKVVDTNTMVNKVFFYLWNDIFKDFDLNHSSIDFPKIKDKVTDKERPYAFGDFFDKVKGEINKECVEDFMKAFMPNTATTAAGTTPQEPTEQTTE